MTEVGIILSNPRRGAAFKAFLAERGCDVLAPTNKYEALRFKRAGRTNVIYRKANGRYTVVGNDVELAVAAFTSLERRGGKVKVTMSIPATVQAKRAKLRGSAVHKALPRAMVTAASTAVGVCPMIKAASICLRERMAAPIASKIWCSRITPAT